MRRGTSNGGGQSSLGYLFGDGEAPKPAARKAEAVPNESKEPSAKPNAAPPQPVDISKQIPAGIHSTATNNYFRADGQNTSNFITVMSPNKQGLLCLIDVDEDHSHGILIF